jgi:hypothetical protein
LILTATAAGSPFLPKLAEIARVTWLSQWA